MDVWETLKISRASYFRYKSAQLHASLIPQYETYRSSGLYEKPWSHNHKKLCMYQLQKYFLVYPVVNYWGVRAWMTGTYSQNKDRHTALSGFARFLKYEGLMDEVEYLKIKAMHPIRSPYNPVKQRIITAEEVSVIVQESDICLFLSETALRISEFSDLTLGCLQYSNDPTRAFLLVQCGKGGKARTVPFSKRAQAIRWPMGKSRYWWGKHIRAVSLKTGIDFSAHSLRHYRVTQWANNPRIPIAVVQRWAGHNDLKTTQGYIHLSDEEALRAAFE